ncbi:MAG: starch-binding protein [Clostridium beijerinckii]|jgi:alpha-amylase|nr:starch-binding protein [Clostridium beijerinckii]MCI1578260.1 starch-binding protein [Clostridium beijerinckii]MCI1583816.1 starch-binding protein [Clostridium beijerinckii]MCI1621459.1 starch-binding protein [Clostridium beijerinckii]
MKRNRRSIKSIIAMVLVFSTIVTSGPSTIIANAETTTTSGITKLTTDAEQGTILHAWDWSFNNIKDKVADIKAAGYSAIQVSPVQPSKNSSKLSSSLWYLLYQPVDFKVGSAQLGTEEEFTAMCDAAHAQGLKIIVDVVTNHTGTNDGVGTTISDQVIFKDNAEYWHLPFKSIDDYNDRYDVTHGGLGLLPDLNTGNPNVQAMIRSFLEECLADGADGLRFDTAKHMELPSPLDDDATSSDYWPAVLDGLTTNDGTTPFVYGENLQGGADKFAEYAQLMDVTASNYGDTIRSIVGIGSEIHYFSDANFANYESYNVPDGVDPSSLVTWVESHDTYANYPDVSLDMTQDQIANGWALIASRKGSTPLYFNRTVGKDKLQGNVGDVGNDDWKNPDVVAVNKFHNNMGAEDETITKVSDKVVMIERGTKGIVIVNLGVAITDFNTSTKLAAGTYDNCATTGGTFTVADGKITGALSRGITVLYAGGITEPKLTTPTVSIDHKSSSFTGTLDLTLNVKNGATTSYSIDDVNKGSFTDGQSITIGGDATLGKKIKVNVSAVGVDGTTVSESYTYIQKDPNAKATVYFTKPDTWKTPTNIYIYNELGEAYNKTSWPGSAMEKIGDNLYKFEIQGFTDCKVIFNDGSIQSADLPITANGSMTYANGDWKDYLEAGISKVYFRKPAGWAEPKIYAYKIAGNSESKVSGAVNSWPGVAMEKVDGTETLYSYTFSSDCQNIKVIFNDGTNQIGDYELLSGELKIYDNGSSRDFTSADLEEPFELGSTVYVKVPDGWVGTPNLHYWNSVGKSTAWPGIAMTDKGNGLYSGVIPKSFGDVSIIINDGSNKITNTEGKNEFAVKLGSSIIFENGEWKEYVEAGVSKVYFRRPKNWAEPKVYAYSIDGNSDSKVSGDVNKWPGVPMEKVDGTETLYNYTFSSDCQNINVIFNDGANQTDDYELLSGESKIYDSGSLRDFTSADLEEPIDDTEVGSTVYVKVPANTFTGIPYIHYWNSAGKSTAWPGIEMTDNANGLYSATIPKSLGDVSIIVHEGDNKLTDNAGSTEFPITLGSSKIFEDGEWKEYVDSTTTPDEPTTPDDTEEPTEVSKTPTVTNTIYTSTTKVNGTAGANADIVLSVDEEVKYTTSAGVQVVTETKVEKREIGATTADQNGNWSAEIPNQSKGTIIKVTAKEEGKLEATITVTVSRKKSSSSSSSSSSNNDTKTVTSTGNTTIIKSSDVTIIRNQILNSTTPIIKVNLSSQSIAGKEIFEALTDNQNKTLILVANNALWTFNGTDILAGGVAANIDTTIKSASENAAMINNLVSGKEVVNLSFAYKGLLPGKATIQANVDPKYNGKVMNMYSYNAANNRLTLVSSNVAVKDGVATFEVIKGSDYILSETPVAGAVREGWNQNTDGSWIFVKDENNAIGWINDGGNWYLTDQSGIMKTGWTKNTDGKWYYLNNSGAMQTGWINDNGIWYYLSPLGDMLSNTSVDGYTLGADGALIA